MTRGEAINWLINIMSDIGKIEHQDLWHYEQALSEIRELLEAQPEVLACGEGELSAQPEQGILSWLLAYHTKSFELHGRYLPHEVIGWLVHDFANAYMAERREE